MKKMIMAHRTVTSLIVLILCATPVLSAWANPAESDVIFGQGTISKSEVRSNYNFVLPQAPEEVIFDECALTDEEIDLIALVTMAEAEGESEAGKRYVIDTIFNRMDSPHFPDTISGVIYQKNAFSSMWNGRVDRCYVMDDIRQLVVEEWQSRSNYDVMFFTAGQYSYYGVPIFQEGNHYFSSYN